MVTTLDTEAVRQASHRYLWMHNRDWVQMAEEGDPLIIVEGNGVRVTDSDGRSWIDVNGGYMSVNVGYGRTEIVEAAYEQMARLAYFPNGTTTVPTIGLAQKLADITPGSLSRVFPVSERLGGERNGLENSASLPPPQRRGGAVQSREQKGLVSRRHRGRPLVRVELRYAAP